MRVGIDIGGTKMLMAAFDGESTFVERIETGIDITLGEMTNAIEAFIEQHNISPSTLGVAVPGLVEDCSKVVFSDVVPCLNGVSNRVFTLKGKTPVLLNDVDAALYGEITNRKKLSSNIVMIMCGTGIGASFYLNGNFFHGTSGWAGELGNMVIHRDKQKGTVDLLASGAALEQKTGLKGTDILAGALEGDEEILTEISLAGRAMGVAVANLLNLLNPDEIVIGGGLSSLPRYFDSLKTEAESLTLPEILTTCRIQQSSFGKLIVARGAALYAAAG